MKLRPNLWIFAPGAIAVVLFGAYAVLWNRGAVDMRKAVTAWTEDVRANGGEASFESFRATGFPFLLRGVASGMRVAHNSWSWSAPAFYVDASPFDPQRLILSVRGPHVFKLNDRSWRIDAPDGRASLARDATRGWLLDVESGPGTVVSLDGKGEIAAQSFLLSAAPNAIDASRIFFGVDVRGIEGTAGASAVKIDQAELAFAVDGLLGARSLRGWRDTGGRIDVQRVSLETAGARAEIAGRLVLDADGYPAGTLNAAISNPAPFAELLRAAGLLSAQDAAHAAAGLTLAAVAGGGKISAPLTLDKGAAHVAGVKVGALPKVLR